jgi:hypothetical protein
MNSFHFLCAHDYLLIFIPCVLRNSLPYYFWWQKTSRFTSKTNRFISNFYRFTKQNRFGSTKIENQI